MDSQRKEYGPDGENLSWDDLLLNWMSAENALVQRDERIDELNERIDELKRALEERAETIDTVASIIRADQRNRML
jgi:uncharacterized coiled-coil DUF342 family protein